MKPPAGHDSQLAFLESAILASRPHASIGIVQEAYYFSKKAHEGQFRESGEPYFIHPFSVALELAQKGMDEVLVSAALMHDVIEDTKIPRTDILAKFGSDVYRLVDGLTKLDRAAFKSRQERSNANLIKTIMAASKDIRVLVIKLYDKLHNMRTIGHLEREKARRIAADALTVYVPISHKLGMHALKYELEDICFELLEPKKFAEMKKVVNESRGKKSKEIAKAISALQKAHPQMKWRFEEKRKSFYSTYSKMIAQDKKIGEINDSLILKVIVPQKDDCYAALGKIHGLFKPIPKKMKDMIAIPEYAIYQSLHTQVIGPGKRPLKIYIFSEDMDRIAMDGIVALLAGTGEHKELLEAYARLFPAITTHEEAGDSSELAGTLNLDFHNRAMIVFTEKGDVVDLPANSTALDFAFFRDEKSAKRAAKAEVNGRIVPLWARLNAGDVVKIHYSIISQLNMKWESLVHSDKARKLIQKQLRKKNISTSNKLARIAVEYLDTPGIFSRQAEVFSKHGLDLEIVSGSCKSDRSSCSTEYYIRNIDSAKVQKAIRELREMQETLDLNVDYIV